MFHPHREDGPVRVSDSRRFAERILLIGWDGADWSVLHPLLAQGRLPHLASLLEGGICLELIAPRPHETATVWTSLATGKRPHDHGVLHASCPTAHGSGVEPVARSSRRSAAIWNILSRAKLRTHIVGWPVTHPAESISGISVSDWFAVPRLHAAHDEAGDQRSTWPPEVKSQLRARRVAPAQVEELTLSQFVPRQATGLPEQEQLLGICRTLLAESVTLFRAFRWCLSDEPWDFAACVFPGIKLCHELAHWLLCNSVAESEVCRELCDRCYEHHDLLLGQLLTVVGEKTQVIAVSPCAYGSPSGERVAESAEDARWARPLSHGAGLAVLRGPKVRRVAVPSPRSALDLAPTVLAMLGIPYGQDMAGRPWLDLLEVDVKPEVVETWDTDVEKTSSENVSSKLDQTNDNSRDSNDANSAVRHLLELGYVDPEETAAREAANRCRQQTELNRAISLLDCGLVSEALASLQGVAEQNPDWLYPHEVLAKVFFQAGQRTSAKREIDWLSWHGDESPPLYLLKGAIALDERNFELAFEYLRCAQRTRQPLPGLLALAGSIHLRRRDFAAADTAFQSSIDLDGPSPQTLDGLATVYLHAGRHEDAALHALDALERDMQFGRAHYHLGLALLALNRVTEARRAFESWAAAEPQRAAPMRWLAHVAQHHLNDLALAENYRDQAREAVRRRREATRSSQLDEPSKPSYAP
jgi:predicted AlkP superfamily phosphohydrolase/phosphomutase/Tfp pilus assembly protein PilF